MLKTLVSFFVCLQIVCLDYSHATSVRHPQEPLPPYPYEEEEVSFHNAADQVTLAGTLTLPRTSSPFPAVILLQGSAPYDRDYTAEGHKFFLLWADYLARQGIAVLRFDKRSAGKSTGDYSISTLENFAQDALSAVAYLKSRKDIDPQHIGLIGHSEGGMTAFLAASKSKDIAFVVSMAAPCVNLEELLSVQEPLLQRAGGIDEEWVNKSRQLRSQMFSILKQESDRKVAENKLSLLFNSYFDTLSPSQREIIELSFGTIEQQISRYNSASFRYWAVYDPIHALKQVKIPILALNGGLDLVVNPEQNLKLIAQTLEETGHKDFTASEIPQLNHAFQTCQTGSLIEYGQIEETTSPSVLKTLADWILERV